LFRQRHADGHGESLSERTGSRLDAERGLVLGVTGCAAAELAEVLDLLQPERVARQVQKGVQKHRAMPIREHETVAVDPQRVARIVLQKVGPEDLGNIRHTHWHARMSRIGTLYSVHGECAEGISEFT